MFNDLFACYLIFVLKLITGKYGVTGICQLLTINLRLRRYDILVRDF